MAKRSPFIFTNFSQGEVSPEIEARVDVAKRANSARVIENVWLSPEGGAFRRPGLKFLQEVNDSTLFTRLIPFQYSTDDAFILEFGDGYIRFFKNRAPVPLGLGTYAIATPYTTDELRDLHFEQSADFMFLTNLNPAIDVQKLIRVADDDWVISDFGADPPPSFEADDDISVGATLTPGATTGSGVNFTISAGGGEWLTGDIGRLIVSGAGRAIITATPSPLVATTDIIDAFSSTAAIPSGSWFLRLAPQTTLDVDKKGPVGASVTLISGVPALRGSYINKFVKLYGGLIRLTGSVSSGEMTGIILSVLEDSATDDPAAAPANSWRLEEEAWSDTRGRPRTLAIHGGRLVFFSTPAQPGLWWGSSIESIYNFAVGSLASNAYQYDLQNGQQNPIQWAASLGSLYIGDTLREYAARGQGVDKPIGGDEIPFVPQIDQVGSAHVQPLIVDNAIVLVQRFQQDVVQMAYSLNDSPDAGSFVSTDLTLFARQLQDMGFAIHRPAYAKKPHSIAFFLLENGQLAGLTFKPRQEVAAWARTVTDGEFESVAIVPHEGGRRLTIYVIVKRTINGATKRYIEYFEDADPNWVVNGRAWTQLHTDSAVTGLLTAGVTTISGLSHLAGETVDVIIAEDYLGQFTVSVAGVVTLPAAYTIDKIYEVGLHYDSTIQTLRPSIPGEVTEGIKRSWPIVFVRVKDTIGGTLNGKPLKIQPHGGRLFSGLCKLENVSTTDDYDGSLTITQTEPYPLTVLGLSGKIKWGEDMV